MRQLFTAILLAAFLGGCATHNARSRDTLTQYLKSHTASPTGKDGLYRFISNAETVFNKTALGAPMANVTFDLTTQTGPDGAVIHLGRYTYVLEVIEGKWTVVESKVRGLDGTWLCQMDFHRQTDAVFADLPWRIQ